MLPSSRPTQEMQMKHAIANATVRGVVGTIYLIHFDRPFGHATHYLGWTADLPARLEAHATGRGSRLMEVVTDAGITWKLARTWRGDRYRERRLKERGGKSRMCPLCGVKPHKE